MKTKLFRAIATVTLLAGLSSAQAAIVDVTYTGGVSSAVDITGMFGPAGTNNIIGASYILTYQFNTALGIPYSSPTKNYVYCGSAYGVASPALSTTVTINGISVSSDLNGYNDETYATKSGSTTEQYQTSEYNNNNVGGINIDNYTQGLFFDNTNNSLPASITTPFSYSPQPAEHAISYTNFTTYNNNTDTQEVYTVITANITNLTVTVQGAPGPIPDAGLLSLGFLVLAGLATRARGLLER